MASIYGSFRNGACERWIDLGNRKRRIHNPRGPNQVRWVTRSFLSSGYRPIWMPGSDRGSDRLRSGRVFLPLAAHLNISLLRKAHWSTSQVHFYGFAFFACGKRTSEGAPLEGSWFPILSWVPPSLLLCPLHFDETFWTMQCARSTYQRVHGNIVGLRKNLEPCTRTSW